MAGDASEFVEIYRARHLPEAHAMRLALEREGIPTRIDNEMLQGAVGELPAGWATAPRILVDPEHAAAAQLILAELTRVAGEVDGSEPRERCLACGTTMSQANVCPECGWSYGSAPDEPELSDDSAPAAATGETGENSPKQPLSPPAESAAHPPALSRRVVWGEVAAVLAVGVVPNLIGAVDLVLHAQPPAPPWLDALNLTLLSGCTIFVTLYLIGRSGESWGRFGLVRPSPWDVALGLGLLLVAEAVYLFRCGLVPSTGSSGPPPAPPPGAAELGLIAFRTAVSAFAEELVTRAYLITRLEVLLRSRGGAVLASAVLFASYHLYQGAAGVATALAFGLTYGVAYLLLRRVWPLAIGHTFYNLHLDLPT